jgi:hypothetical protein
MEEDHTTKQDVMSPHAPLLRKRPRYIIPAVILVALALCAVLAYRQIERTLSPCKYQPASMRNPPVPAEAEQVAAGTYDAPHIFDESEGAYKGVHKELHYETISALEDVYTFYKASLSRDGWSDDIAYDGTTKIPNLVQFTSTSMSATFHWSCGFEGPSIFAVNWIRASVLDSGKTHVSLNYEYIDYDP